MNRREFIGTVGVGAIAGASARPSANAQPSDSAAMQCALPWNRRLARLYST